MAGPRPQHGGRATLTPLSSSSTLPGRRVHTAFFFGLSFLLVLEGQAGSAFPGAPAQALTGGHGGQDEAHRAPWLPQAKTTTRAVYLRVCGPERGQGQVQVSLDLPGLEHVVWGQPYYSRSSVKCSWMGKQQSLNAGTDVFIK